MTTRLMLRASAALERRLPERRLFIRSGDHTREKPGGGSAVSTIEGTLRRAKAAQPQATDSHLARKLGNVASERAERVRRLADVLRIENAGHA